MRLGLPSHLALLASTLPAVALAQASLPRVDEKVALAEASAMIAATPIPDAFKAAAYPLGPVVVHRASGMTCPYLSAAKDNTLFVFDPGNGEGKDVGCRMPSPAYMHSLFASHISHAVSIDHVFSQAVGALKMRAPNLAETDGAKPPAAGVKMARFVTGTDGRALYERVAVFQRGDWIFTQRFTAPAAIKTTADRVADVSILANIRETPLNRGLSEPSRGETTPSV